MRQFSKQMANPALKFAPSGRWDAPSARPLAPYMDAHFCQAFNR